MTDVAGPFDGSPWAEAQWYRHAPMWAPSGVYGPAGASTSTGGLPFATSGLQVSIGAGRANVRGAGFERTGTPPLQAVTTNGNATLSRRDRVVLRRNLATHTVTVVVIQGTPASTPVAPAVTQVETGSWDLPLFSFLVPPNNGTSITGVIDERVWLDDNGSLVVPGPQYALLHGTGTQSLVNDTPTTITLGTEVRAVGMTTTVGSGRINCVLNGIYDVSGGVSYDINTTGRRFAAVLKNGTVVTQSANQAGPAAGPFRVATADYQLDLVAGDFIQLQGYQQSGGALDVVRSECFLQAHLIAAV